MSIEQIREAALALPVGERADLAEALRDSLGPRWDALAPAMDLHPVWAAELDRRSAAMESGEDPGVPCEDVMAELDALVDRE